MADESQNAIMAEMLATMREMRADSKALRAELDEMKQAKADEHKRVAPIIPAKEPWAEEIWVEALQDCTHPDPPSPLDPDGTYGVYRKAAKPGDVDEDGNLMIGAIFRLKHRELLAPHMRELSAEEVADIAKLKRRARAKVAQTTARGVKVTNQF